MISINLEIIAGRADVFLTQILGKVKYLYNIENFNSLRKIKCAEERLNNLINYA